MILNVFETFGICRELTPTNFILLIALLMFIAISFGIIVARLHTPKTTGYIIAGIIIGPNVLNLLTHEYIEFFSVINKLAIGFIGYTIGLELFIKKMRQVGKLVTLLTIVQTILSMLLVSVVLIVIFNQPVWFGLLLGAIATAIGAPPLIMVMNEYKTKGPITTILHPLLELVDVTAIILFVIVLSISNKYLRSEEALSVLKMFYIPIREIGLSVGLGIVIGYLSVQVMNKCKWMKLYTELAVANVFLGVALAEMFHGSIILLPLTIGAVEANLLKECDSHKVHSRSDIFSIPLLIIFFVMAGAELDIHMMYTMSFLGFAYIGFRVIAKYLGSYITAKIYKADPKVLKYLGLALIPQAGVAIDMALTSKHTLPHEYGMKVQTLVLGTTLAIELFGIFAVKWGLKKAGEYTVEG